MCPPLSLVSPSDISIYWTDEEIFMYLDKLEQGSPLASNVYTDINPFQYMPSDLPGEIWYLVHSEEKKDTELGFWMPRGEAYAIFDNSRITGCRSTLEFYEGQAPHGQRTGWLMQEYKISKKGICDKNKPKDSRLLYRVFLADGVPNHMTCTQHGNSAIAGGQYNSMQAENPKADSVGRGSTSKPQRQESPAHIFPYISAGDYLELNDLAEPETPSSSDNSSVLSMESEDYFDLHDLEDEINQDLQKKSYNFRFCATTRQTEVVICPASSGSIIEDNGHKLSTERMLLKPAAGEKSLDKKVVKHTTRQMVDDRKEGTLYTRNVAGSSNGRKPVAGEKKASVPPIRTLKKKYFCCMPF